MNLFSATSNQIYMTRKILTSFKLLKLVISMFLPNANALDIILNKRHEFRSENLSVINLDVMY